MTLGVLYRLFFETPRFLRFFCFLKEPRAGGYQNKPKTGGPFHFPFPFLFLCSLFSLQWKLGRVLLLPTSFLLFLFFHKVKECGGTQNRGFFLLFFSPQFSDMEKLENFSQNLAKFIKFYARKPENFPHYYLLNTWKKNLKKKLTLSIWGINSFSQFYEVSKKLQIIMPKHRKLLSKLGTWEKPNSSIFLKNKLQDWGGVILYFLFLFPKKGKERNGLECGVSI